VNLMMMCLHIPATIEVLQLMRARGRPHTTAQNAVTFANGEISSAANVDADNSWMYSSAFTNGLRNMQGYILISRNGLELQRLYYCSYFFLHFACNGLLARPNTLPRKGKMCPKTCPKTQDHTRRLAYGGPKSYLQSLYWWGGIVLMILGKPAIFCHTASRRRL
jgi:hypothetical protein